LANRGFNLRDVDKHIVHTLRRQGYFSALFGVQHIHVDPTVLGYDLIVEGERVEGEYDASKITENARAFLQNSPSQPFFLSVGYSETHRKFHVPGPSEDPRYCLPPAALPDTPETRRDMAAFKASVRILDQNIGAVLDALDSNGLAEDTLVICTTDHGIAFPGMKCGLKDHGIGVMLIVRGPGGFVGGQVCDAMVSHIDIFPTVCDLLEMDPPEWLQGKSLLPLSQGDQTEIHDEILAEVNYHTAYEPERAVRTRRWKYIRHFGGRSKTYASNVDASSSKELLLRHGLLERAISEEQLYDLVFDPNETHNLTDDPAMTDVLNGMRGRLGRWMRRTNDPLLDGPIPAPPGATVNKPDDLQAGDVAEYLPPNPWNTRRLVDTR